MKNKNLVIYSTFILMVMFFGCSSAPKTEKTSTVNKPIVWEINDSQSISDSLISSALTADWKKKFTKKRKPIVVVGRIENNSTEKIDVTQLAKDLERSLINSGEVTFIADKQKREVIRTNRKNSSDFPADKFKKYLKSLKADFFIEGNINTNVDSSVVPIQKNYTLNLEVLNTRNASVVWKGSQSIVK
jgi:PBP1b-binding outer membrane lipoprotein LpoB